MNTLFHRYLRWVALLLISLLLPACTKSLKKSHYLSRGEKDFRAGAYDNAKIDYLKVLQVDPTNVVAYTRLGQMWLEEGAPFRAGAFLQKAAELAPGNAENRLRLAKVYQVLGGQAEARKEVVKVLEQIPANGEALITFAELARSPAEMTETEKRLENFPEKERDSYYLAKASLALRKQDIPAAQEAIEKAISLAPKSADAHQARGVLELLKKNPKNAGEEFKIAADLAPPRSPIRIGYAEYLRQTGQADAAAAYLKASTAKFADFLPGWVALGRIAVAEKKYDEALHYLENVFSRDPDNLDGRLVEGEIRLAQRQPDKAIAGLEKLDQTYRGLPPVKYRLAQAYLLANKIPQAAAALDQALAKNPNFTEAILARAELNLRTGHGDQAIDPLEKLLAKQPDLRPARVLLAEAYRVSGRLDDAAKTFRDQATIIPGAAEPYYNLGLVQVQQNKPEEARKSFEEALARSPDNIRVVEQLVRLDIEAKDFAAANRRVQAQLEKHPDAAASYLLEGRVRIAEGKWKEAEAALRKTLEKDAKMGAARDLLVAAYMSTGRPADAVHELEAILGNNPKNQTALVTLAEIYEKQKQYAKAAEAYERVLTFNPDFLPGLNNLSYLYLEQLNQPEKAYQLAQKARKLDSGDASVADTLGWANYKRGDYPQALTLLQEAASKAGTNPEIQFHLGMAYYMMGQPDAARTALQKAVAPAGDFPHKAEAQQRLSLLGDSSGVTGKLTVPQLEQMVGTQPADLVARLQLARAYEEEKEWIKAAESYEAVLKINPKLASVPLKLAQIYSSQVSNKEKALVYAKAARSLAPNDPKTSAVLGRIAFDLGDFNWSYDLLRETARQIDSDPAVLHDLAWSAYSLGKLSEARDTMQRSLQAAPESSIANDARMFLAMTAGEADSAAPRVSQTEVDSQLKANPQYVPALMVAAQLDLKRGDKAAAVGRYQKALERFPNSASIEKQLALVYGNDPAHAGEAFDLADKARKALPDDPDVARLLGRLCYERKDYRRAIQLLEETGRKQSLDAAGLCYLGLSRLAANQKSSGRQALNQALANGLQDPLATQAKKALANSDHP